MFVDKKKINKLINLDESKIFYPTEHFYVPKLYFYNHCVEFCSIFSKIYKINYTKVFNCVRHSDLFKTICYYKYDKLFIKEKQEGLSIGNIFYIKEDDTPHVLNIVIYEENKLINFKFFEPQTLKFVNITDKEKDNIKYIIF